jgi:hypothetical protein
VKEAIKKRTGSKIGSGRRAEKVAQAASRKKNVEIP